MSGYFYELPTTEPLSFSSCYSDTVGFYIAQVADTTERRANLRTLLKDAKRNSEKDYLRLVKVRPHLTGDIRLKDVNVFYAELRPWMIISRYWLGSSHAVTATSWCLDHIQVRRVHRYLSLGRNSHNNPSQISAGNPPYRRLFFIHPQNSPLQHFLQSWLSRS